MALAMLWHVATLGASLPPQMIVFGHKIPDTDAICAAMTYEWELNERGIPAKAYRLGKLNRETEYVLKSLGSRVSCELQTRVHGPHARRRLRKLLYRSV